MRWFRGQGSGVRVQIEEKSIQHSVVSIQKKSPKFFFLLSSFFFLPFAHAADEADVMVRSSLVAELLILFGCVFILAAAIGMVRFPDFYARLHAASKLVTLGGIGIFGGAAIAFGPLAVAERLFLIAVFFFLTAPLTGYMVARAGYLRGLEPYKEDSSIDEWNACGAAAKDIQMDEA